MSDNIEIALYFTVIAFTVFYITLMVHRIKLEYLRRRVDILKQQILYR